ncbi:restriction endonuclease subunit S [Vreelandella titanicae]|uniref:restriction endonuclease subunit S n=1 Tax=Vreelandella titanicae TaxID=664683 RepID=UPI0039BF6F47
MSNRVPEGWGIHELGDLAKKIEGGGTPPRIEPTYWDGGIPWATVKDLRRVSLTSTAEFISAQGLEKSSSKLIPAYTMIIACRMAVGKAVYFDRDVAINQDLKAFYPVREVDWRFILHWYLSQSEKIENLATGSTVKGIRLDDLKLLPIDLPPLPEQKKIAAILSSVDEVIKKTRAQIDKLKDLKTGMMQELLTKGIGSGGVPHTEFKDSPVGRIPAEWEVRRANDISDAIMVGVVIKPTQYYVEQGVPALRSANVRENGLTMDNLKFFSPESNDQLHKSKLRKGDLLTVRTGYPGTTAVVTKEFEGCNCIDVVITRPSSEMDSNFFCLWVNSDHGKGQVLKAQGGLAQQHFNVGDMKNLLVPVPPLEEQRGIFRAVDAVIGKLSTSEKRLARFRSLKKALMQDLLTGKIRVNVEDCELAEA